MGSSVDMKSPRGITTLAVVAALSGGGGSLLQSKIWGPGGGWEDITVSQAVMNQQLVEYNKNFNQFTSVVAEGFKGLTKANEDIKTTQITNSTLLAELRQSQRDLERRIAYIESKMN